MSQSPFTPASSTSDGKKAKSPFSKPASAPLPPQSEGPKERRPFAWQPLTFRGVAAFSRASFKRLFIVQFICAAAATASVLWFLDQAWLPTLFRAVRQMPSEGEIRRGKLDWRGPSPQLLAESHFLAFVVDLDNEASGRSPAQIEVLFRQNNFKIISLFGFIPASYPPDWRVAFNQPELEAWWGAWEPWIVAGSAVLLLLGFLLMWASLATVYFLPIWLAGFFTNRDLTIAGSWRLAGAALLPGALFLTGTIICYGLGQVDLVKLLLAGTAHVAIGWAYVVGAVVKSPLHPVVVSEKQNPFSTPETSK